MASNQYGYPPPPPPPPSAGHTAYPQQYQQQPYSSQQSPRGGGGRGRGRGGNHNHGGRGDFHVSAPYNQHAGGYNGPPQVGGGYLQQNSAPYIGPQPPIQGPPNGYPPQQQWHDPQQQHHHHQQPQVVQAPAPVPLSAQNYHPNYAPQVYQQPQPQQQPPQYGPQQPPFQHSSPPPQNYAQSHIPAQPHPSGPPQQQWQAPPHHAQPPYQGGGRGRGRGGPHRGGFEAPLMGPPIRMGFDNDRSAEPMPQASNGYPPPYAQQQGPPVSFPPQPQFQGYPPDRQVQRAPRPALDPNPFYSGSPQRGRGGFHDRGRRGGPPQDRFRGRGGFNNKNRNTGSGSFGSQTTDLPQKPVVDESLKSGDGKKKKKKKRKVNTLGLTPATEDYQDSEEEDDVDEEARLAAKLADHAMMPSELDAWLAERRAKWPTKARREAKEAELAKRRAQAAEQSARDKAKAKKDREERDAAASKLKGSVDTDDKLERQRKKAEKLRKALEKAERKIQDGVNAGMKRKRDSGDIGDEDDLKTKMEESDHIAQVIAKAEAEASAANGHDSDSSTSESSEYTSDSDSDSDSAPEAHTSRQTAPIRVPPPPKKAILQRHCKYFATGGTCGKKGKCRFIHDESVRAAALKEKELNGGRPTLAQRLAQNDREKADLMVLKSIKHLHDRGLLDEPNGASAVDSHNNTTHDGLAYNGSAYGSSYNGPPQSGPNYNGPSYNPASNFMDPFHAYDEMQPGVMDEV